MRRVELTDQTVEIVLTGLTMLEAMQGRLSIPYNKITAVHPRLNMPPNLLRLGGTSIGSIQEGHYLGDRGWYFLSYENPDRVVTLELDDFHLGRQPYHGVAVEVPDPQGTAGAIDVRRSAAANADPNRK